MSKVTDVSRRRFLQGTGLTAGVAAVTVALGGCGSSQTSTKAGTHTVQVSQSVRGMMFLTNDLQFATIAEAAERIYPKDETGPGAKDLGVPYFIDNQLAAGWGFNAGEYTAAPHFVGAPTQGYQGPLNRRNIFLQGIDALNREANVSFNKDFPDLEDAQKDQILKKCEAGQIEMPGLTSAEFFNFLKSAVVAGVYSDPIYNGNNNMDGWRARNYPGAQMSYYAVITGEGFKMIEPMSLADMRH